MSTVSSFRSVENKHDVYIGKDSMKKFYEFLRQHAMKIINFKKKKNDRKARDLYGKLIIKSYHKCKCRHDDTRIEIGGEVKNMSYI